MKLTYIKQTGEPNGDAGDQYTGLDRFGRVVDQRWPEGSSELERVDYGFTAASNRQWRQNLVAATGQDEYYDYDGLYQVAELNRGTLNGGKTAISGTPTWTEDFTYDPIGNWDAYLTKVSGVTDLDQTRTHNTANQTTEIDGSSATVSSDLAGNMVKVPQVANWEATFDLKWDAWNRLVEVGAGETVVAEYRYDGKTRRVSKVTVATRHYYYSDRWQIVEERLDSETTADRQFIWGQRYLDDLVLRDRDVDADGSLDERLYVLSDYFNPTAIADVDGIVLERYGYNAFGLSRVMTPDFEPRISSDFDWETRYGAYRYDAETGFYQVRFRYLHPTLGKWISRDPVEETGGYNLYAYANDNGINVLDIIGLAPASPNPIEGGVFIIRYLNAVTVSDTAGAQPGFEVEYQPQKCQCNGTIVVTQAVVHSSQWATSGNNQFDLNENSYKTNNKTTKGGIPIPGYREAGGRAGEHGALSYIDTPSWGGPLTWMFEICALCRKKGDNGKTKPEVMGCTTIEWSIDASGKNYSLISKSPGFHDKNTWVNPVQKPGDLFKKALEDWQKSAGK